MNYDVAVIGGGIIGLATAYRLVEQQPRKRIAVIEKEAEIGSHQTGRNSGVIHSGVYYKAGSLKAENCRLGRLALIDFCDREGVDYEICGKVIVATEEKEIPELQRILDGGRSHGVACRLVEREELAELEPHCDGIQAIHVPEAGIVDYRGVARRLADIVSGKGGDLLLSTRVIGVATGRKGVVVKTTSDDVEASVVVNCAGLYSDRIARLGGVDPGVQIVPFRGEYYELREYARPLCRNLIYPVPDPAYPFLGVHFTRMIDGRVECGPNAIVALAREGYRFRDVNISEALEALRFSGFRRLAAANWRKALPEVVRMLSKRYYLRSLNRLIPEVRARDLVRAPAGVRAQALRADGSLVDDFLIVENERFISVCNAPSPAATACLNIGRLIAAKVAGRLAAA